MRTKALHHKMNEGIGRRRFLTGSAAIGVASLLGPSRSALAGAPPEVKKIRLPHTAAICLSPQYVAEELLRLEGFNEVEFVDVPYTGGSALTNGQADVSMDYGPSLVWSLDTGQSLVALAGIHSGCYQLVANQRVQAIRGLKGNKVAISGYGRGDHIFLATIVAYVGVDPTRDIDWFVTGSFAENMRAFEAGKVDAFLAFPPQPQKLREKKLSHVILDGTHDQPWSQYTCCLLAGNRDFVAQYPIATKRAVRAILKATDLCAQEPDRAARIVANKGFEQRYDIVLEVLKEVPYRGWRDANPEDALRFYALRLHEAGMIKSSPQKIIAQGTDWRFLNELKKELKG
jgi:NitT/TauT family transport system substrate-binding protein